MLVDGVKRVENLSDCMKEDGGKDGNSCKVKCLKEFQTERLIGCDFSSLKSVMMDARKSCKKSVVQMHLFPMAKCKTPIDSWCLKMSPGKR